MFIDQNSCVSVQKCVHTDQPSDFFMSSVFFPKIGFIYHILIHKDDLYIDPLINR